MTEIDPLREIVRVELGDRSYEIVIGPELLDHAGATISQVLATPSVVIVTDATVGLLHGDRLAASLEASSIASRQLTVAAGEASKSFEGYEALLDALLATQPDRQLTVVALGGGVVGDLAGFAAATLLRGVDLVQVPTTLLAQVDSAVGGKTGINTRQGKNLVGAFHQPRCVLADTAVLDNLPDRELRAGYAEVVKYGLIDDAAFFTWLETNGSAVLTGDAAARQYAITTSCRSKARIVAADEREAGPRALLNLGHTFGHAFERAAGYGPDPRHGEAVAVGLVLAFQLSARLKLCAPDDAVRIANHLHAVGLAADPTELPGYDWTTEALLSHMGFDKKARSGKLRFVLARGIGESFVADDVLLDDVRAVLDAALSTPSGSAARQAG